MNTILIICQQKISNTDLYNNVILVHQTEERVKEA